MIVILIFDCCPISVVLYIGFRNNVVLNNNDTHILYICIYIEIAAA